MSSSSSPSDTSFSAGGASAAGAAPTPTAAGAATTPDANCGDQSFQITGFQGLGKESSPVGLYLHPGSLEDGGDLLGGDGHVVVGKDEGSVHTGQKLKKN